MSRNALSVSRESRDPLRVSSQTSWPKSRSRLCQEGVGSIPEDETLVSLALITKVWPIGLTHDRTQLPPYGLQNYSTVIIKLRN